MSANIGSSGREPSAIGQAYFAFVNAEQARARGANHGHRGRAGRVAAGGLLVACANGSWADFGRGQTSRDHRARPDHRSRANGTR